MMFLHIIRQQARRDSSVVAGLELYEPLGHDRLQMRSYPKRPGEEMGNDKDAYLSALSYPGDPQGHLTKKQDSSMA